MSGTAYIRIEGDADVVEIGIRDRAKKLVPGVLLPRRAAINAAVEILCAVPEEQAIGALKRLTLSQWPDSELTKKLR